MGGYPKPLFVQPIDFGLTHFSGKHGHDVSMNLAQFHDYFALESQRPRFGCLYSSSLHSLFFNYYEGGSVDYNYMPVCKTEAWGRAIQQQKFIIVYPFFRLWWVYKSWLRCLTVPHSPTKNEPR